MHLRHSRRNPAAVAEMSRRSPNNLGNSQTRTTSRSSMDSPRHRTGEVGPTQRRLRTRRKGFKNALGTHWGHMSLAKPRGNWSNGTTQIRKRSCPALSAAPTLLRVILSEGPCPSRRTSMHRQDRGRSGTSTSHHQGRSPAPCPANKCGAPSHYPPPIPAGNERPALPSTLAKATEPRTSFRAYRG
jgi:hypothetical protein